VLRYRVAVKVLSQNRTWKSQIPRRGKTNEFVKHLLGN